MSRKARKAATRRESRTIERAETTRIQASVWRAIGLPSFASALVLWAAFFPLGLGWLGWLAPLGWLLVIERRQPLQRFGYFVLWLSGGLFWLLTLQGIRLAYWPLTFGWIALSLYLAIYVPLFVLVSRILVLHWRIPLVLAAPAAWVGCELVRGYVITGFSANLLAHTQSQYPLVIQFADQFGGYGVSSLVVMVAVGLLCGYQRLRKLPHQLRPWQPILAIVSLLLAIGYGVWRLAETDRLASRRQSLLRIALIQENAPSFFESNPERARRAWASYLDATREAGSEFGDLDLVVWPESTFTPSVPMMRDEIRRELPPEIVKANLTSDQFKSVIDEQTLAFSNKIANVLAAARGTGAGSPSNSVDASRPFFLVGCSTVVFTDENQSNFNSAVLIGPNQEIVDRYDKVHLVMFGEYIPLGWALSFLGRAFGFSGTQAGSDPKCFEVGGVELAPSICFESVLPHFLSWQVRTLRKQAESPDILVNITNDSWFRGSSILDHHLACAILASVEHRRPMLVAANGGLSAWIDGAGRIQQSSPRLSRHLILATPYRDNRWGLFQWIGDGPAWMAAAWCTAALVSSLLVARRSPTTKMPNEISTDTPV